MTILIIVLAILMAAVIIVLIAASSAPNSFEVYGETVINKPADAVYNYTRFLKNQDQFNKWVMADPNVRRTYQGTDGEVGCVVYWDSDMSQVGKGEQEILALANNSRIDWALRFEKPFKNTAGSYLETTAITPGSTKVKWAFTGQLNFMMKVMHVVLGLKKVLTKDLQTSVEKLKVVLEKQ